ncbi:PEP-CTERM sorting domain-containing protein [Rubritalea tangerina]|uniref:PEP-CTERM sorting domain-containing protein n=1 Tax=Rubritalea tangerina TaxID=430798 RepID=A0ABW4ZF35_9BACT
MHSYLTTPTLLLSITCISSAATSAILIDNFSVVGTPNPDPSPDPASQVEITGSEISSTLLQESLGASAIGNRRISITIDPNDPFGSPGIGTDNVGRTVISSANSRLSLQNVRGDGGGAEDDYSTQHEVSWSLTGSNQNILTNSGVANFQDLSFAVDFSTGNALPGTSNVSFTFRLVDTSDNISQYALIANTADILAGSELHASFLSSSGSFDGDSVKSIFFDTNLGVTANNDFKQVNIDQISIVPEPTTTSLLLAFGSISLLRRRRASL